MLKCKYCGWDLPEDARVCTYCGHPVELEDDEQKRRLNLKCHLNALVIGMNAPKSVFPLSTAKTSNTHAPAALVVFLISTLVLANIVVIGTLRPHEPQNGPPPPTAITFIPHTTVDPFFIDFGMVEIGSKAVMPLMIKTNDTSQFTLEVASASAQWLSIALQSETKELNNLRDIIYDVTANTSPLKVGQYSVILAIKSSGGPPQQVPIKIQVIPPQSPHLPAELHISPQRLDFGAQNVRSQTMLPLTVSNLGGQTLDWSADKGQIPWLTLDTSNGSILPGGHPQIIKVRVDTTTLTKGQHSASIHFTSNGGHISVNVVLNVVFMTVNGPAVSSITPGSGPQAGGTTVTINGSRFNSVTGISFGSSPGTRVTFISDTQITAVSPAGTGIVDVTVSTPNGTSTTSSADLFTYNPPKVPMVTNVSPNKGKISGGTNVTISGTGFTNATVVSFGRVSVGSGDFTVNNDTQITMISPPAVVFCKAACNTVVVDVMVTTPIGTSQTNYIDKFTYLSPPIVSSISQKCGSIAGGNSVTITGANFTYATKVFFGTKAATSFTTNNDTQITAFSPPGSTNSMVDVTVTTPGGTSATNPADVFTYPPPPTVTGIKPNSGPAAGNTGVTIAGAYFTCATGVSFGTNAATSVTINSDSQITAVSPAGTGTVDVTVTTPGGTSNAILFNYLPPPTLKDISPNSGSVNGGITVTINGSGFGSSTSGVSVSFGGALATITSISDTQIVLTSPAGTGIVDVMVTTTNGTSATSLDDQFSYQ